MWGAQQQGFLFDKCLVIDLRPAAEVSQGHQQGTAMPPPQDGAAVFKAWLAANLESYWSPALLAALPRLRLVGVLRPCLLLVTADPAHHLDTIRAAWTERTLRPPAGHTLAMLGEADGCSVSAVPRGQFTSLSSAVCHVIHALNGDHPQLKVTVDEVCAHLRRHFPHLELPDRTVVFSTLGALVRQRKVYHTSSGYRIVTPGTYQQQLALELQADTDRGDICTARAVQTDLADIIIGGTDSDPRLEVRTAQAAGGSPVVSPLLGFFNRRLSMKLSEQQRQEQFRRAASLRCGGGRRSPLVPAAAAADHQRFSDETATNHECSILERPSLAVRLARMAGAGSAPRRRLATFSAQFPPPEWTRGGSETHLHSVGVQTTRGVAAAAVASPKISRSKRRKGHKMACQGNADHPTNNGRTRVYAQEPSIPARPSTLPRRNQLSKLSVEPQPARDAHSEGEGKTSDNHDSSPSFGEHHVFHSNPADRHLSARCRDSPAFLSRHLDVEENPSDTRNMGTTGDVATGLERRRRHVRERLEVRLRNSSGRTGSRSSLERRDRSPGSSLERNERLEMATSPGDSRGDGCPEESLKHGETESPGVISTRNIMTSYEAIVDGMAEARIAQAKGEIVSTFDSQQHFTTAECPAKAQKQRLDELPTGQNDVLNQRHRQRRSKVKCVNVGFHHSVSPIQQDPDSVEATKAPSSHSTTTRLVDPHDTSHLVSKESVAEQIARRRKRIETILKRPSPSPAAAHVHERGSCANEVQNGTVQGENRDSDNGVVILNVSALERVQNSGKKTLQQNVVNTDVDNPAAPVKIKRGRRREKKEHSERGNSLPSEPIYENVEVLSAIMSPSNKSEKKPVVHVRANAKPTKSKVTSSQNKGNSSEMTTRDGSHSHQQRSKSAHQAKSKRTTTIPASEKQMNNKKLVQIISPLRSEPLSVKNIFTGAKSPKFPPKALIDPERTPQRRMKILTINDLVKSVPPSAADIRKTSESMGRLSKPEEIISCGKFSSSERPWNTRLKQDMKSAKLSDTAALCGVCAEPGHVGAVCGDTASLCSYPSLPSSLDVQFTSLAARRLVRGGSVDSLDTLVEVNMAADGRARTTLMAIL